MEKSLGEERSSRPNSGGDAKLIRTILTIEWSSLSNRVAKSLRNKNLCLALGRGVKFPSLLIRGATMFLLLWHPPRKNGVASAHP